MTDIVICVCLQTDSPSNGVVSETSTSSVAASVAPLSVNLRELHELREQRRREKSLNSPDHKRAQSAAPFAEAKADDSKASATTTAQSPSAHASVQSQTQTTATASSSENDVKRTLQHDQPPDDTLDCTALLDVFIEQNASRSIDDPQTEAALSALTDTIARTSPAVFAVSFALCCAALCYFMLRS